MGSQSVCYPSGDGHYGVWPHRVWCRNFLGDRDIDFVWGACYRHLRWWFWGLLPQLRASAKRATSYCLDDSVSATPLGAETSSSLKSLAFRRINAGVRGGSSLSYALQAMRATWCGLILSGSATSVMAETAGAFGGLTSVACGVGFWRLTVCLSRARPRSHQRWELRVRPHRVCAATPLVAYGGCAWGFTE